MNKRKNKEYKIIAKCTNIKFFDNDKILKKLDIEVSDGIYAFDADELEELIEDLIEEKTKKSVESFSFYINEFLK